MDHDRRAKSLLKYEEIADRKKQPRLRVSAELTNSDRTAFSPQAAN
jgi:hypothetical protein